MTNSLLHTWELLYHYFIYTSRLDTTVYTAAFKVSLRMTGMAPSQPAPSAEHLVRMMS